MEDPAPEMIDQGYNEPETEKIASSVSDHFERIATDLRQLIKLERSYYRDRFVYTVAVAKWTGFYLMIALCAAIGAVLSAMIGTLLIISNWFGPVIATVILTAALVTIALVFGIIARRNARNFIFPEIDRIDLDEKVKINEQE